MPSPKNYYQKIEEGYPYWIAEGRTLAGQERKLAYKRKWRREHKENNKIAVTKYRDKMRRLYGGTVEQVESRMKWEVAKGVVDLGTREIK